MKKNDVVWAKSHNEEKWKIHRKTNTTARKINAADKQVAMEAGMRADKHDRRQTGARSLTRHQVDGHEQEVNYQMLRKPPQIS